jgi:preprotein translocase subunit SecG
VIIALTVLHVLTCFALIAIVLLQSGKGADIGSAFGGAGSQAVFGSMGTPTILGKITATIAVLFAVLSFTLAMIGGERTASVVREAPPATTPAPATPEPATSAPAGTPAAPAAPAPAETSTPPAGPGGASGQK